MRKIRVLHLIKSLNRGGAETLLVEGLSVADRERFDLSYAYFHPRINALASSLAAQDASVTCISADRASRMLLRVPHVARYLRENHIDILHCHLPIAGIVGRLAGRITGTPVIYTEHNKVEWYRKSTFRLHAMTYGMQRHVVAVSQSVKDSIDHYIKPSVPVTVIRNGINPQHFSRRQNANAETRARLGLPADAPVVGNIASFITQKRLDHWLQAAGAVARQIPEARFILLGEGPLLKDMKQWIIEQGLQGRVILPGSVADVRPYLAAMDVYMMSSDYEGLPVALMEAMAMRCAPVCTAVGGIPEVIENEVNGFLTPQREPHVLAERIIELLRDPVRLTAMSDRARETVLRRFTIQRMTLEIEALYDEILGEKHSRGRGAHTSVPLPPESPLENTKAAGVPSILNTRMPSDGLA